MSKALHPSRPLSPQARLLRRAVVLKLLRQIAFCVAIFGIAALVLDQFLSGPVATWLANTAETHSYRATNATDEAQIHQSLQAYLDSKPNAVWDIQTNPIDHSIWVRDLTLYHFVKVAWLPALGCVALLVVIALVLAAFRHVEQLVDNLTAGVSALIHDKTKPVALASELAVTEHELEGLRKEAVAQDEAAQRERARTQELMAYLAHDVRTPLTAVIGNLSLLAESERLNASEKTMAQVALGRANEIGELAGELFDVTRISLDPASMRLEPVDLHLLTLQVVEELSSQGPLQPAVKSSEGIKPGLEVLDYLNCLDGAVASADPDAPNTPFRLASPDIPAVLADPRDSAAQATTVLAEPELLAKALRHILQNALTLHNPSTPVIVDGNSNGARALVLIRAEIAPMSEAEAKALAAHAFEPFYLKGSTRGISLEFAREVARAHGGDVTLCLRPCELRFTLSLPTR